MLQIPRVLRPMQIEEILSSLPEGLEKTYDKLLQRIGQDDVPEMALALKWLSLAKRPLYVEEVIEASILNVEKAVPLDPDRRLTAAQLWSCLTGLVTVEPELPKGSTIQAGKHVLALAHSSVRKYLILNLTQSPQNSLFHFHKETTDEFIAKCCVEYFSHCAFVSWRNYPLARYSNRFWDQHAIHDQQLLTDLRQRMNAIVAPVLHPETDAQGRLLTGAPEYVEDNFATDVYGPSPQSPGSAGNGISTVFENVHSRLDHLALAFRLFILLPSHHWDEELEGRLQIANLDDVPHYEALSYSWEDPASESTMVIDGRNFVITTNLDLALRHHREQSGGRSRTLWVDAICINQTDAEEKSRQVTIMPSIFSAAFRVVAWLGASTASSELAMERLARLQDIPPTAESARNSLPSMSEETWSAIQDLLRRPVFLRSWIVQELIVARNIEVMCGTQCLPWSIFELIQVAYGAHGLDIYAETSRFYNAQTEVESLEFWQGAPITPDAEPTETSQYIFQSGALTMLLGTRTLYQKGRLFNFFQQLLATRFYSCTDMRDRIYSFRGLFAPEDYADAPPIDYSLSPTFTFTKWSAYWLLKSRNLDLLSCLEPAVREEAPSWSCNPALLSRPLDLGEWNRPFQTPPWRLYSATSGSAACPLFANKGLYLILSGVLVGAVRALGEQGQNAISHWRTTLGTLTTSSVHDTNERFWRTVLADQKRPLFEYAQRLGEPSFDLSNTASMLEHLSGAGLMHLKGRTFFLSSNDLIGLCPRLAQPGDHVVLLRGGRLPFILRPVMEQRYRLIGEA